MDLERTALPDLRRSPPSTASGSPPPSGSSASRSSATGTPGTRDYAIDLGHGAAADQHHPRRRDRPGARPDLHPARRPRPPRLHRGRHPGRQRSRRPRARPAAPRSARAHAISTSGPNRELPPEDARRMVAARIMAGIYHAILDRIERRDYDVFGEKIRVPRPRRAGLPSPSGRGDVPRQGSIRRACRARSAAASAARCSAWRTAIRRHRHRRRASRASARGGRAGGGRGAACSSSRRGPRSAGAPRPSPIRATGEPRRQRPARAARLLPRDVPLPDAHRRARSRSRAAEPRGVASSTAPGRGRRCAVRRCRRRSTCSPA